MAKELTDARVTASEDKYIWDGGDIRILKAPNASAEMKERVERDTKIFNENKST